MYLRTCTYECAHRHGLIHLFVTSIVHMYVCTYVRTYMVHTISTYVCTYSKCVLIEQILMCTYVHTLLLRALSALAFWAPIFGEVDYLSHLAFPFAKLFQNNRLLTFEVLATLMSECSTGTLIAYIRTCLCLVRMYAPVL